MDHKTISDNSPFHHGEQEAQLKMGVREKAEKIGAHHIRNFFPDQHRRFYENLPFILTGTLDDKGQPWASPLVGQPGFIKTPDQHTMTIEAAPLRDDPLEKSLRKGAEIGLLGIDLETRRRNRINGYITAVNDNAITINVRQTFGNCPQYIQTRKVDAEDMRGKSITPPPSLRSDHFEYQAKRLIEEADTFFIASAYSEDTTKHSHGADVSHRGGKQGFVKIEGERTIIFPDFSGNNHYNTIGNILANPKTGILFIDFAKGDLLYLTGEAEIIWNKDHHINFQGADKFIRFKLNEMLHVYQSLPMQFTFQDYSPRLARTGNWTHAKSDVIANKRSKTLSNSLSYLAK